MMQAGKTIEQARKGRIFPVYLFLGERPITTPVCEQLLDILLPGENRSTNLDIMTLEEGTEGAVLESLRTRAFFPGRKIVWVQDGGFLLAPAKEGRASTNGQKAEGHGNAPGATLKKWLERDDHSKQCVLLIQAAAVDTGSRLFKAISKKGKIIDLRIPRGSKRASEVSARQRIRKWLRERGKEIGPKAIESLMERVNYNDPLALMSEIEKLSCIKDGRISRSHVQGLVRRSREEELFELTGALNKRDLPGALDCLGLLLEQNIPPLVILGVLRNYIKKLIALRAAMDPNISATSFGLFQSRQLPVIQDYFKGIQGNPLRGTHPYGLFRMALAAEKADLNRLLELIANMPEYDLELKGGVLAPRLLLEGLVMDLLKILKGNPE